VAEYGGEGPQSQQEPEPGGRKEPQFLNKSVAVRVMQALGVSLKASVYP